MMMGQDHRLATPVLATPMRLATRQGSAEMATSQLLEKIRSALKNKEACVTPELRTQLLDEAENVKALFGPGQHYTNLKSMEVKERLHKLTDGGRKPLTRIDPRYSQLSLQRVFNKRAPARATPSPKVPKERRRELKLVRAVAAPLCCRRRRRAAAAPPQRRLARPHLPCPPATTRKCRSWLALTTRRSLCTRKISASSASSTVIRLGLSATIRLRARRSGHASWR